MYKSFTKNQAVYLANSGFYKELSTQQIAQFQIIKERSCMPFGIFEKAVTKTVGHPVFTHEFVTKYDTLVQEIFPNGVLSEKDILNFIPKKIRDAIPEPTGE